MTKTPRSAKSSSKTKKTSATAKDRPKRSIGKPGIKAVGAGKSAIKTGTTNRASGRTSAGKTAGGPARTARTASGSSKSGVRTNTVSSAEATITQKSAGQLDEARALALAALEAALDKKALMPVLIDVSAMASYTDFIGIVSGRSDRQVEAIADGVSQFMKSRGRRVLGQEGGGGGRWTLLDFGEIVIHVFYHPIREFYDLESLWIEAPRVKMAIPPEAILTQPDALYGAL